MNTILPLTEKEYIPYTKQLLRNNPAENRDCIQVSKPFSIKLHGFPAYTGYGYSNFNQVIGLLDKRILKYCQFHINGNEVRYDYRTGEYFIRNSLKTHIPEYVNMNLQGKYIEHALMELERRKSQLRYQKTWLLVDLRRDLFCEDIINGIDY